MRNTIYRYWFVISLILALAACQSKPKFINHPQPNIPVTYEAITVGCLTDEYGSHPCISEVTMSTLGCDAIEAPTSLIGGLDPSNPIAVCEVRLGPDAKAETLAEIDSGLYFYRTGGLLGSFIRYVIVQDGAFRLIKTKDEFREIFAPIESPEEALSYALAVEKLSAGFGLQYYPEYKYEVNTIEDTHVTPEGDGYRLHLFSYELFGCGPHWTYEVEIQVARDGLIQHINSVPIFRDPNQDELCVD